jgi:flavin reductase (DIM6/NTAB) family NADH-FMN oxidoreductase RutF
MLHIPRMPCSRTALINKRVYSSQSSCSRVKDDLRALLRETAQPVAVVTALMPSSASNSPSRSSSPAKYHGATLSSFSSVALDPHPLVIFSLRVPSRMATSLSSIPLTSLRERPSDMVINILSGSQASLATRFARPDLHPRPFDNLPYSLTTDGLPVLDGSLGALSCSLVSASWPLHDLEKLDRASRHIHGKDEPWEGDGVASELFIARVVRVERQPPLSPDGAEISDNPEHLPLLYHRRKYTTTGLPSGSP